MAKIHINNPKQVINGGAKKYYFKVKGLGGPKGDKGDTGATGPQGPQGPQGNAATVSVGSTTTLPVGQDATVQNVGTLYNAVLNFGIPQGPRGPQGATGAKGDKGDKGDQGNPGPQGEKGTNATVYVGTTTTTNPGTQARVYNSGTDSNAVLNFEIPRGDVGPSVPLVQETGYSTTKAMSQNATTEALNGKQNTLTAGSNIQISGSTISATDTKYSAGNGITLTGTQFSANTSVLATKNDLGSYYTKTQIDSQMAAKQDDLVAGSNIQIAPDGKTISATDTTYTAGTGLTLTGTEFSADTTVLATQTDLTTALAPKLEAEVVTELPTTGEEGKLYLTPKNYTRGTGTGNPITATVAEEAGKVESFQLDGDTFQQTYTGKNLYNFVSRGTEHGLTATYDTATGTITVTGTSTANYSNISNAVGLALETGQTFTSSIDRELPVRAVTRVVYTDNTEDSFNIEPGQTSVTWSPSKQVKKVRLYISLTTAGNSYDLSFKFQIVSGSTPDYDFEPFVGGQPSPSPDYPQPIQTVTGEQTVSINGANYLIDLGSIELCKLGTYQDYIWKDGESWKVHKALANATFASSSNWSKSNSTANNLYINQLSGLALNSPLACNKLTVYETTTMYSSNTIGLCYNTTGAGYASIRIGVGIDSGIDTVSKFGTWLSRNTPQVYYALATATDTVITDTTLIAQLEAIRTAILENGTNTITNTATGSNLAGDMEIGYYGFNPTNRYDKWLWLDLNNNYEQIGS